MRQGLPSLTATGTLFMRAVLTHSGQTKVFPDPPSSQLLPGPLSRLSHRRWVQNAMLRAMEKNPLGRALIEVPLRARYTETRLEERMHEGVRQYVILGAGWDTFVFRRPDLLTNLRVFEVDHPATQRHKRRRLAARRMQPPPNLTYVPLDFEREHLASALRQAGLDPQCPTFVGWQGVSYYLGERAVLGIFDALAQACRADLDVVFDYIDQAYFETPSARRRSRALRWAIRIGAEPFRSGFTPARIETELAERGYRLADHRLGDWQQRLLPAEELGRLRPVAHSLIYVAHFQRPGTSP